MELYLLYEIMYSSYNEEVMKGNNSIVIIGIFDDEEEVEKLMDEYMEEKEKEGHGSDFGYCYLTFELNKKQWKYL